MIKSSTAIMVAFSIMLAAAGCKKSYVDQMAIIEKKACACADKGCADAALKDLIDVYDGFIKTKANKTLSIEELTKFYVSYGKMVNCIKDKGVPYDTITMEINKIIEKYR